MSRPTVNYSRRAHVEPASGIWDVLTGLAVLAPFVTIPAYVIGVALLQDSIVDGSGNSWGRAATLVGVVTGVPTAIMLGACVRELRRRNFRFVPIAGTVMSGLALAVMIYGLIAA